MIRLLQWISSRGSLTTWVLSGGGGLAALALLLGYILDSRRLRMAGMVIAFIIVGAWTTARLTRPAWLRAALADPTSIPSAATPTWTERAPGLESADLPVMLHGAEVDRIALVRIDPGRWNFSVHLDPTLSRTVDEWQRLLGAGVVVNGSYFQLDATPSTPIRAAGNDLGPRTYQSIHGAFVAGPGPDIIDLRGQDALAIIDQHSDALVSYPLLVDGDGNVRAEGRNDWLATRSFVAIDRQGRVLLGTTDTGFFSLRRLGMFLASAPLDLRIALNLDGGPLAAQSIDVPGFHREVQGSAEITDADDVMRLWWQAMFRRRWPLPIVLAVTPR